jgi:hypothetical protein
MKKLIEWIEQWDWEKIFYLIPLGMFWVLLSMLLSKSMYGEAMCIAVIIIAWKMTGKHNAH